MVVCGIAFVYSSVDRSLSVEKQAVLRFTLLRIGTDMLGILGIHTIFSQRFLEEERRKHCHLWLIKSLNTLATVPPLLDNDFAWLFLLLH